MFSENVCPFLIVRHGGFGGSLDNPQTVTDGFEKKVKHLVPVAVGAVGQVLIAPVSVVMGFFSSTVLLIAMLSLTHLCLSATMRATMRNPNLGLWRMVALDAVSLTVTHCARPVSVSVAVLLPVS